VLPACGPEFATLSKNDATLLTREHVDYLVCRHIVVSPVLGHVNKFCGCTLATASLVVLQGTLTPELTRLSQDIAGELTVSNLLYVTGYALQINELRVITSSGQASVTPVVQLVITSHKQKFITVAVGIHD
jgi:hypothetical protein